MGRRISQIYLFFRGILRRNMWNKIQRELGPSISERFVNTVKSFLNPGIVHLKQITVLT